MASDGTVNVKAMEDKIGPNNIQLIKHYVNQFTRNRNIKRKTRIEEVIKEFINRHYSEIQIVLQRTQDEANKYSEILQREGYKPNFALKRFKITELPKETRNYLHGVYVIADPRFKENTNFFKKFINSNVLLVDEDINSGASLRLAAEADFVICLYNPRSKGRSEHLAKAFEIMGEFKDKSTPVGIVKDVGRADEEKIICTFDTMEFEKVDMTTMVIIGNKATYIHDDLMITPRGYSL